MAAPGNPKDVMRLPHTGQAFFAELKEKNCLAKFAAGTLSRKNNLPVEVQQMFHYSYPGLTHGRPLSKVMIVLVGQSGAGKSTTINALFNDPICKTSDSTSETRAVTEYGKELCVKDSSLPSVVGTLSFVDPPGALDVDQTKEATNLAIITKFRDECPDLRPRKGMLKASYTIREYVYPNLVLMVIRAADNRMHGPDSNVRKCLRALEKYRFLDRLYPNVVVVVTHAMTIPPKSYKETTRRMTRIIQEAIFSVLNLRQVQVVFIENMPEEYNLVKPNGCDFYELPDGQLSHYNLIAAMEKQFNRTGDMLGKLLCGWYFSDECPEKKVKANVLNAVEHTELSADETNEALQMLAGIDMQLSSVDDLVPPSYNFQLLGHGYCLKSETPKDVIVYEDQDTVNAKLLNTLYSVPKCFQFKDDVDEHFMPISFETKEVYEKKSAERYGLDTNVKLVVHVDSSGRWIKDASNKKEASIRAVFEKRLLSAKIDNPEKTIKKELMDALHNLPDSYTQETADHFKEFFHMCGSHFVQETWLGGYVTIDNPVKVLSHTEKQGLQLFNKAREGFKSIISPEREEAEYGDIPLRLDDRDIQKCTLAIQGGDPPQISMLSELTAVRYTDWVQTVKRYPVELQYSLKLSPYHSLVKDANKKWALTKATQHYLEDKALDRSPLPTRKYVHLVQQVGPNPKFIASELKRHHAGGNILPSEVKRNKVGNEMVEDAQVQVTRQNSRCVIL